MWNRLKKKRVILLKVRIVQLCVYAFDAIIYYVFILSFANSGMKEGLKEARKGKEAIIVPGRCLF